MDLVWPHLRTHPCRWTLRAPLRPQALYVQTRPLALTISLTVRYSLTQQGATDPSESREATSADLRMSTDPPEASEHPSAVCMIV